MKYPKGSVVKLPPGQAGRCSQRVPMPDERFRYGVEWDSGSYQVYDEKEIQWATVDRPKVYGSLV
ncbi:Uncharacterised protein [Serratia liquefaciens]|nr:Uncharacterised protein [Serratia liquefaciens]